MAYKYFSAIKRKISSLGFMRCRKLLILARVKTGNLAKREFKPKTGNLEYLSQAFWLMRLRAI